MHPGAEPAFVDSSAFYALLDHDDANHKIAKQLFEKTLREKRPLLTSNFVIAETHALTLHRLGREAAIVSVKVSNLRQLRAEHVFQLELSLHHAHPLVALKLEH